MKRFYLAMMICALTFLPVAALAQPDPCRQAEADAREDIKSGLWTAAGCIAACLGTPVSGLGVIGVAHWTKTSVPTENLIGKSWDYTDAYTTCYQEEMKKLRTDEAVGGCITGSLIATTIVIASAIIAVSSLALY